MAQFRMIAYDPVLKRMVIPNSDTYLADRDVLFSANFTLSGTMNGYNMATELPKLSNLTITGPVDLDALKAKSDLMTVTGAVDLDTISTRVNQLDAAVVLAGSWDASFLVFPTATSRRGESWICVVAGNVDGIDFAVGDRVVALIDNAPNNSYAGNWLKLDYTDKVSSVAGKTGVVTLVEADISDLQPYLLTTDIDSVAKLNILVGDTILTVGAATSAILNIAAPYTVLPTDDTVNATANTFDLTLYTAVGNAGRKHNLKNSGTGVVTILTTAGQTIDAAASGDIVLYQYDNLTIQSDGTNWIIL